MEEADGELLYKRALTILEKGGGRFGSGGPTDHRNLRSSQIQSEDRPRRSAAVGDARLFRRWFVFQQCLSHIMGPVRADRRGCGSLSRCASQQKCYDGNLPKLRLMVALYRREGL